jgi:hypothetical protein
MTALLRVLVGCDRCPDARPNGLYAHAEGPFARLCSSCWVAMGRPWPRHAKSMQQVHESEVAIRAGMTARGSTDRHMVRNGRT